MPTRLFLAVTPLAFAALLLLHPTGSGAPADAVIPNADRWLTVHLGMVAFLPLMAAVVWLFVRDLDSRSATVARWSLAPFVALYGAYEAALGIASGVLGQSGHADAINALFDSPITGDPGVLGTAGGLAWITAAVAAAIAARGAGASRTATALIATGGLMAMHVPPFGQVALVSLAAGMALARRAPRAVPVAA